MASTAESTVPCAVMMITGTSGSLAFTDLRMSMPPSLGITRSVTTMSAPFLWNSASPCSPSAATVTSYPFRRSIAASTLRRFCSSSTTRTLAIEAALLPNASTQSNVGARRWCIVSAMPIAERETELAAASPMAVPESVAPEPIGPDPGEAQLPDPGGRGSFWVATGILVSRLFGLVRERVFAYYFGNSIAAGAFKAAFRIPNFLQNLFGEGVLSASFIPVYAKLIARGDRDEADHVAGAVFAWLSLITSVLVAAGLLLTPQMISVIAPGFRGESRELTIRLVRIFFPGTGLLVLSAWCLGILNSHRKFCLSYAAPVIWSCAQIVALVGWGNRANSDRLAAYVALGAGAGSALQFLVQLPWVLHLLHHFRPTLVARHASTRTVFRNFLPILLGRGVVQVSAFVDTAYASLISERAVAALAYAQM